jgi:hypothetical protein
MPSSQWVGRRLTLSLLVLGIVLGILIFINGLEKRSQTLPLAAAPRSSESMEQEALALQDKGEYQAAEELFRKCLAERQRALGADHIDTLAAMNNLANLLHERGENRGGNFPSASIAGAGADLGV